jgi:hypothetical protein
MLYGLCPGLAADFGQQQTALVAICAEHAYLDQFMSLDGAFDFGENAGGKTVVADHDNRVKSMGAGLEIAALCRREGNVHGRQFISVERMALRGQ